MSRWTSPSCAEITREYNSGLAGYPVFLRHVVRDRTAALLRRAAAAGYKDADHLAKDTDLDPLRQREDFRKLLADLRAKAPAAAPPPKPER